jgi:hypothetical protein
MKGLGVWLQPVCHWLVAWLISKWGPALVLIGTLALAGSAATYLPGASRQQAGIERGVPGPVLAVPTQSLCTSLLAIGAFALPAQCDTAIPAQSECTPSLLMGPDFACDER